ncbi:MAG: hypothetical protein KKB50_07580 [Planctomycetes bacterium]|nr:hypothetical protein [Planctomycetota bacterium]
MRMPDYLLRGGLLAAVVVLLGSAALADEQTPRALITQGNGHFAAGRYAEALVAYQQASDAADGLFAGELLHNRAAANFKLGQIDEARELWVRAAALQDAAFEAAARYNLGNCDYAEALKVVQAQDVQGALGLLERAAAQYRDAIRLDPQFMNARANLELTQLLKQQLEQLPTTQPQSQSQSGTTQQQDQQNQSSSQPSSQPQDSNGEGNQQQQDQQQSTQPSEQQQPTSQPEPEQSPDEQPPSSQPAAQPESQPSAGEDEGELPPVPVNMTRAEAERLLQLIRERERARREELARRAAAQQKAVERDW